VSSQEGDIPMLVQRSLPVRTLGFGGFNRNPNHVPGALAGAKIWVVLSSDVNCTTDTMSGWNPIEYLFEHNLITFDDTDVP